MSAPDVNIDKQTKRHRPALMGISIAAALVLVFVIGAAWMETEDDAAPELVAPAAADQ